MKTAVIFGGAGFIGQHFSKYLLDRKSFEKIYLVDIQELDMRIDLTEYVQAGLIELIRADVREPLSLKCSGSIALICNFAAVHREPGHDSSEYYDTNLPGALNVCNWAEEVGCNTIIFTSSIAPYGPTETVKSERSNPNTITAYGGSKLAAEKMHETWHAADKNNRTLVITRPGVVFGAGERGNVSRLIQAIIKGYFFFMGNKDTRKAGVYVKELCSAMWWVVNTEQKKVTLFNMSMNPGPTMDEYVSVICNTAGIKRRFLSLPFSLLFLASLIIDPVAKLFKINQPVSPVRLKKLVKSNNIVPEKLSQLGYEYQFTFQEAMSDWKGEAPAEWS